ncbi:hypothetical protein CRE_14059 [Caenorhabditis remanei]|uniref:Carbohydrate sulfotransferase n=2 Tax=Caenorhabditis remanei TaxID=31234 RepID=E3M916_CAERE|nr:hypothetical protein CRE_14059 [Caenorhabditis remanei]
MSIETRKQFREQKWINLMLSSRRLQLRFILFATVFAIFCLYYSKEFRFSVSTSTFLKNSSNTTTEKLKKVPKFYKLLNWEKRESEKKLNNIEDLRRVNLNTLPNRTSNLSAVHLCSQNPSPCLPGLRDFEGEIRTAPRYRLSTCVVQKSMSTVMTSLFCYLRDEKKFIGNNREILKDWKIIRFCMFKNEFRNLGGLFKKFNILPSANNWTHIMMVRNPIERFISGFVDKCYRKPVVSNYCNGCKKNLTCFMETELARMREQVKKGTFLKTYEDRHFFPQSWRCDLHQYFSNFTFIPYSSAHNFSITSHLFPIFRNHSVPESSLQYIQSSLSSGRTAHSTVDSKATSFIEKRLKSSPYLMELLVKMFYHDFKLFNFTLPAI